MVTDVNEAGLLTVRGRSRHGGKPSDRNPGVGEPGISQAQACGRG